MWYIGKCSVAVSKGWAIQMEKRQASAFLGYFMLLLLVVITGMKIDMNIINLGYLVVVLSCFLKFILIVNFDKR